MKETKGVKIKRALEKAGWKQVYRGKSRRGESTIDFWERQKLLEWKRQGRLTDDGQLRVWPIQVEPISPEMVVRCFPHISYMEAKTFLRYWRTPRGITADGSDAVSRRLGLEAAIEAGLTSKRVRQK